MSRASAFPATALLATAPLGMALLAAALPAMGASAHAQPRWGSFATPFAADSPWNSRPANPIFGTATLPPARYLPAIETRTWSTGVFRSVPAQGVTAIVQGSDGRPGPWHADARTAEILHIPRWPRGVVPARGDDGHAELVDQESRTVHSFWQLRPTAVATRWTATLYAWSDLAGTGWGDPARPLQGARAAGVPALGGLIRVAEVDDGRLLYRHALAMSLPAAALAAAPAYVHPATSADTDAARRNTGAIPLGTLLMLPPSFDTARIGDPRLRKIAVTLQTYGAYVVDRNGDTGFVIYAETGSRLDIHGAHWNSAAADDLERMRVALRPVTGASGWIDGNGRPAAHRRPTNILSMRGPWEKLEGNASAVFDSRRQMLVAGAARARSVLRKTFPPGVTEVSWAVPRAGAAYRLRCVAHGGSDARALLTRPGSPAPLFDSGNLRDRQWVDLTWPEGAVILTVSVRVPPSGAAVQLLLTPAQAGPDSVP